MSAERRPLRLAILGTSGIAAAHLAAFRRTGRAEIAAVYSRDPGRAEEFAKRHAVTHFTDSLDGLLSDKGLNAAIIATEPARHAGLALRFLQAGKPVLIEKPLDLDLNAAQEVARFARESGIVASVVAQRRFEPALIAMKLALERLGPPLCAHLAMMWRRDRAYYQAGSGWRGQSGAVFLNQGIHGLDILNWFFGRVAHAAVSARATRDFLACPDRASALITYENGVTASVHAATCMDEALPDSFSVTHAKGRLDYSDFMALNTRQPTWLERLRGRQPRGTDLLLLQSLDFLDAVQEDRPPASSLEDAIAALKLALALSPAANGDRTVFWQGPLS